MAKIRLQEKFPFLHLDCITLQGTCIKKKRKISYFLEFLFEDFRIYQESNNYQTGQSFCVFEEPLLLLNDLEKIDLPIMHLTAGRKRTLDIENYRQEVIKKIQALHYNQSS